MNQLLEAKSSVLIDATADKVWQVLLDPAKISNFMMGMQPISQWKEGDELRWLGRHEEKPDDNAKGTILRIQPGKQFSFTFFYPGYGYPDTPQYYNTVVYQLEPRDGQTLLTVTQGDFSVFEQGAVFVQHSQGFWNQVTENLKTLVESV